MNTAGVFVRVWMRPSELGESGYSIDYPMATAWYENKRGDLLLHGQDRSVAVAKVKAGRWDSPMLVDETELDEAYKEED